MFVKFIYIYFLIYLLINKIPLVWENIVQIVVRICIKTHYKS